MGKNSEEIMEINLISDTVTKPTPPMLEAMMSAKVGDNVLGQDPTVRDLERKMSQLFGKEAAIFCPSGTMTNQIAVNLNTQPGDLIAGHKECHIYHYEVGGVAALSGVTMHLLDGEGGKFSVDRMDIPEDDGLHTSTLKMICLENTVNRLGGVCWSMEEMMRISRYCKDENLICHLDGARVYNAIVEKGYKALEVGCLFDTISICLSKGLGAPVGSVLLGTEKQISEAVKIRKRWGGGMRQSGYLAAAGIYALDHHVDRLREDHEKAKALGKVLRDLPCILSVADVETNIVIFCVCEEVLSVKAFTRKLADVGIRISNMGGGTLRMVTHLDFTDDMMDYTVRVLKSFAAI